jgi:Ca2+-transporting ATPase
VTGIGLGRRIFTNLRLAMTYITAVHIPVAGVVLLPLLLGLPPLLYPMHLVILELIIDPLCSIVFEAEPSEADAMKRPPRNSREPLFGLSQIIALVAGQLILAPAVMARSGRASPVHHSRMLWMVTTGASLILVSMLAVPELRQIMRFSVPDIDQLLIGLAVGIAAGGWFGLRALMGRQG